MAALAAYGPGLHRSLMRRLANSPDARDMEQEAYLRLLRAEHTEFVHAPQAYLFRIASNVVYEIRLEKLGLITPVQRTTDLAPPVAGPAMGHPAQSPMSEPTGATATLGEQLGSADGTK